MECFDSHPSCPFQVMHRANSHREKNGRLQKGGTFRNPPAINNSFYLKTETPMGILVNCTGVL